MDTDAAAPPPISGRPRQRNRLRWALSEFLGLPLLAMLGLTILAGLAITVDLAPTEWLVSLRNSVNSVVPSDAMASALQTIAPGLLTAISIIFFVMVMAVNQQAGTYTTVVLDQFMQRRLNQAFLGLFVGLAIYVVAVLMLLPAQQMVLTVVIAAALILVGLAILPVFIYNIFDQLRPSSSAAVIEHLARRARGTERRLLARCHRSPQLRGERCARVTVLRSGYLIGIDVDALATVIAAARRPVEIEFRVVLGARLVAGATVAEVRSSDQEDREQLAAAVLGALTIGRMRNIRTDAGYSVDQLATMAWAASSSQQDPEGASVAIGALHSLLASWVHEEAPAAELYGGRLPIVYYDEVPQKVLDALTAVITATGQSGQHQTCADVLTIFANMLPRLSAEYQRVAVDEIARVVSTVTTQVLTARLERALARLRQALYDASFADAAVRLEEIELDLARQARELTATSGGS